MALFGADLRCTVRETLCKIQLALSRKGVNGIRGLQRTFRDMDVNGNRVLDPKEFERGLAQLGIVLKPVELQALLKWYDLDGDGNISFEEFSRSLRQPLTDRRIGIVQKAFRMLDRAGRGFVTADDIADRYNTLQNFEVQQGKVTKQQALQKFLNNFEGGGDRDGRVTESEFLDYYTDVSANCPTDDAFVAMMESTWMMQEREGEVDREAISKLIRQLQFKLSERSRGCTEEAYLRRMFRDLDTDGSGVMTMNELGAIMLKLGIPVERKYVSAVMNQIDVNGNGAIEFEEFVSFLCR
eukprot:GILK01004015.1.p1 GENE.GILK01004015.1~~GILK01004015.1.p1  ORF type:complete len:315 (-),score=65.57 GILK01004015.1:53-943(-)